MLLNKILLRTQNFCAELYQKSSVLRFVDNFILISILALITTLNFASSDHIGYFAIFTILLTFIKLLIKPNEKFILSLADKFLLIYFMIVLISVAGSSLLTLSIKGFSKTIIYIGFYISLVHYLKDNLKNLKLILLALTLSVFVESLIAINQNFISVSEISGWQDMTRLNPEDVMTRVYGSIKPFNPNLFGGYILTILPSTLATIFIPLKNRHYKTALCAFLCLLMGIATIFMTGCRGAYLGLFIELILFGLLTYKFLKPKFKKLFLTLSGFISSIIFMFIISITSLRSRIFSIFAMRNDSSNSFRFNVYNSCIEMFKDNWLLGIGVGNQNFREIYGLYMKTGFDALSAYNIYLEIAVESGIFALLAFISFILVNLKNAFLYINKKNNIKSLYLAIAASSIIGIFVHGIVDTVFFRPQIQFVFWIMVAIIRVMTYSRGVYGRARN